MGVEAELYAAGEPTRLWLNLVGVFGCSASSLGQSRGSHQAEPPRRSHSRPRSPAVLLRADANVPAQSHRGSCVLTVPLCALEGKVTHGLPWRFRHKSRQKKTR